MSRISEIENYRPDRFVNQTAPIQKVKDLVNRMSAAGDDILNRAVIFTGVRGSGKSWLSLHFSRHVFKDHPEIHPFLISLLPGRTSTRENNEWWPQDEQASRMLEFEPLPAVEAILDQMAELLGIQYEPDSRPEDKPRQLEAQLEKWNAPQLLLLIVDSAYESPLTGIKFLQRYITTPLLRSDRVAVVITGRGQPPVWESPYLRSAEVIPLEQFPDEDARKIIQDSTGGLKNNPDDILRFSGRYPLSLRFLSSFGSNDMKKALEENIEFLLQVVGDEDIRERIKKYVRRLAVLDDPFRDEDVLTLLEEGDRQATIQNARYMSDLLQTYNLMEWISKDGAGGHFINDSLRQPVRGLLEFFEHEEWEESRQRACEHFTELAERFKNYQRTSQYYSEQAEKYRAGENTASGGGSQ